MPGPPPPPPPPPPMPGFGGSGLSPPPPPPGGAPNATVLPARPPAAITKDRGALLTDITKGANLKKAVTNDRSAPQIGKAGLTSSVPPVGSTPTVPRPQGGLAPPVPTGASSNRGRSNSDNGRTRHEDSASVSVGPQLGGIFAGVGIPKLKKTGGGIETGADRDSSYLSEPEMIRTSAPKPPISSLPKPPIAPRPNSLRPSPQTTESSPPQPSNPFIAHLRKPSLKPLQRPNSEIPLRSNNASTDITPPKAPPPPLPATSKPPPPPINSRKPSSAALPQPHSAVPSRPIGPPPTPVLAPRPPETTPRLPTITPRPPSSTAPSPPGAPPPPPIPAPRTPPSRSTPLLPLASNNFSHETSTPSLAMQAARNAFGNGPVSPALPPPPPPVSSLPIVKSSVSSNPLVAPPQLPLSRPVTQKSSSSLLDPSSYTLSNGNLNHYGTKVLRESSSHGKIKLVDIEDSRWHFQDESQLPKPRDFVGGLKKYRAGRGTFTGVVSRHYSMEVKLKTLEKAATTYKIVFIKIQIL